MCDSTSRSTPDNATASEHFMRCGWSFRHSRAPSEDTCHRSWNWSLVLEHSLESRISRDWCLELFPTAMSNFFITAHNSVTAADVSAARLGTRFGRMDLSSQLALLAAEPFAPQFDSVPRDRIAIILAARAGSLPTDVNFWEGRDAVGGLSPTLFTYTLPSAAIGEIAIRHRLTGPNLCFVGDSREVLVEAEDFLNRKEADACVCVFVDVISPALNKLIGNLEAANATAALLQRNGPGLPLNEFSLLAV